MPTRPMKDAPRDGTPVVLFAKYAPDEGIVCRWKTTEQLFGMPSDMIAVGNEDGGAWVSNDGIAAFDWHGWLPLCARQSVKHVSDDDIKAVIEIAISHAWHIAFVGRAPDVVCLDIERLHDDPATLACLVAEARACIDGTWKEGFWPEQIHHVIRPKS